jgi:hypothetical protein
MSTNDLHEIAQSDTPADVEVPKTLNGLIIWAVGRFGSGAVIGILCVIGLKTVYEDSKATNKQLLTVMEENVRVNQQTVSTLEALKMEIHDAHNRADNRAVTIGRPGQ